MPTKTTVCDDNARPTLQDLTIERWPIERLLPYPRNARTHSPEQIAQVAASILEFGWTNPILVGKDNMIIAGHARLAAARRLEMTEVPVIVLAHLSEAQRRALVLADNKLALNAGWDEELLKVELASLADDEFNLEVVGFTEGELDELLAEATVDGEDEQEDPVPELATTAVSRTGDVWLLGKHRLLVGDATNRADVERLMAGDTADLVFTDPPYNVDYQGYTEDELKIEGDRMTSEQFRAFLTSVFTSYRAIVKSTASMYVCHPSSWQREFQETIEAAGFEIRCQIIWGKNTFAWGFGRYKFQHEPLFYCHMKGESDAWYGDKSQSTLWQVNKPAASRLHPTMKPISLIRRALQNSSRKGNVVVDLFGGSGSTLIACERMNRAARLMEIDPRYADVVIRRWQETARKNGTLQGDGRTFAEVAAERAGAEK